MASNVTITIIQKKKLFSGRNKYRWAAMSVNGREIANSGQWYSNRREMIHILHLLFGPKFNGHKVFEG